MKKNKSTMSEKDIHKFMEIMKSLIALEDRDLLFIDHHEAIIVISMSVHKLMMTYYLKNHSDERYIHFLENIRETINYRRCVEGGEQGIKYDEIEMLKTSDPVCAVVCNDPYDEDRTPKFAIRMDGGKLLIKDVTQEDIEE